MFFYVLHGFIESLRAYIIMTDWILTEQATSLPARLRFVKAFSCRFK